MKDTSFQEIDRIIGVQRNYFASHQTKDVRNRIHQLKRFKKAIQRNEKKLTGALWEDLHKSYEESYLTEISLVLQEIDIHMGKLKRWAAPKRVPTPLQLLPSSSRIIYEPLGTSLIIAPWNYPFQLLMNPVVGAISSGCCALLKPSPHTPKTATAMEELIKETFDENYIGVVQGGREVNTYLLEQRFDFIFFTGSPFLGKIVMKAASTHLTPVVLELGGKSPCIVDKDANLDIAAKRIAWGKTINAGQTCIAPDYLSVHQSVKAELLQKIGEHFLKMFGPDIKKSKHYCRIVNQKAFDQLINFMKNGKIVLGGETDAEQRFISPTILEGVNPEAPVMQEEIFGPLLPVLTFERTEQAIDFINQREKPLAFYYFGKSKAAKNALLHTSSGGGCINDTIMQIVNHSLPFGGVGNSGMGKYHGFESFKAFSNPRAIIKTPTWFDLPAKYPPYKLFKWIKKVV